MNVTQEVFPCFKDMKLLELATNLFTMYRVEQHTDSSRTNGPKMPSFLPVLLMSEIANFEGFKIDQKELFRDSFLKELP